MADEMHALLLRIGRQPRQVEIRIRLGEAELVAAARTSRHPSPCSSLPPARREIHWPRRSRCSASSPPWSRHASAPEPQVFVPRCMRPPDADVLERLHPGHVAQLVRLIEVQDEIGHVQPGRIVGDLQRAPGRDEGRRAVPPSGPDDEGDSTALSRWPVTRRSHMRGIVDQRRLVNGHVHAAGEFQRHRRMRLRQFGQRRPVVEILVAIPLTARDPPGRGRLGDRKLGELIDDVDLLAARPASGNS